MGVADELQVLQDLHHNGKLTDAEFTTAKTTVLGGKSQAKPKVRMGFIILLLASSMGLVWYISAAPRPSPQHQPVQWEDQIENVPAHSYRAISFTAPYAGNLEASITVLHGNPVDVFVIGQDQLANLQALKWSELHPYGNFNATKTQTYERTGQLPQGTYYLVLRDTSLGILSASASDVSLKMRFNP
jgi:hypothetical protein